MTLFTPLQNRDCIFNFTVFFLTLKVYLKSHISVYVFVCVIVVLHLCSHLSFYVVKACLCSYFRSCSNAFSVAFLA